MQYEYQAKVLEVIDGDTVKFSVRLTRSRAKSRDLGMHVFIEDGYICVHENLRFNRINAAEHGTAAGDAATAWLKQELPVGMVVDAKTLKDKTEKYGRFLADLTRPGDTQMLQDIEVAAGHALYWDGHGPRPV
jgi:endonuclease YncB( thermonuclease family)